MKFRAFVALAILFLAAAPFSSAFSQTADEQTLRRHYARGLEHFERQEYERAAVEFEQFLSKDPSSMFILQLFEESGERAFWNMMRHEPLKGVAERILTRAVSLQREWKVDPDRIRELVDQVLLAEGTDKTTGETFIAFQDAKQKLVRIGQPAVPHLLEKLINRDRNRSRPRIMLTLSEMGEKAAVPLARALRSREKLMRQNAATILGSAFRGRGKMFEEADLSPGPIFFQAVAALKEAWENPDEEPAVKEQLAGAIEEITGKPPASLLSAAQYYYLAALGYHQANEVAPRDLVVEESYAPLTMVWVWDESAQRVTSLDLVSFRTEAGQEIPGFAPSFLYNELMAEQGCYDALRADTGFAPAVPLLITAYTGQLNELETLERTARTGAANRPEFHAVLRKLRENLTKASVFANAAGKKFVYQALRRALLDGDVGIALRTLETLADLEDGSSLPATEAQYKRMKESGFARYFPDLKTRWGQGGATAAAGNAANVKDAAAAETVDSSSLLDALEFPDQRVRYAAARTLVRVGPSAPFYRHEKVVPVLAASVGESSVRVVLIVTSDQDFGNRVSAMVESFGYIADVAIGGIEGIQEAKSYPAKDLVILDSALGKKVDKQVVVEEYPVIKSYLPGYRNITDERLKYAREVFLNLRADFRTAEVPILVVTEPDQGENRYKTWTEQIYQGAQISGIATRPVEAEDLRGRIRKIFEEGPESARDSKAQANELARSGARALSLLKRGSSLFDVSQAVPALIAAADEPVGEVPREESVRIACMDALAAVGDPSAFGMLTRVFSNTANSGALRAAAARAAGAIMQASGQAPTEVVNPLRGLLSESDPQVWNSASVALGQAGLSGGVIPEIFREQRLHIK